MSCKPQKPTQLAKLRPIAQALPHPNFDRMLIHRKFPQNVDVSVKDIDLDGIITAIDNLNIGFEETNKINPENLNDNCVNDALVFVRALNTLEEKISDSTFKSLPKTRASFTQLSLRFSGFILLV
ncbi:MAG: hypothetical protein AAFW84_15920, partial [Cyanobacteria bacterium J06635_15]